MTSLEHCDKVCQALLSHIKEHPQLCSVFSADCGSFVYLSLTFYDGDNPAIDINAIVEHVEKTCGVKSDDSLGAWIHHNNPSLTGNYGWMIHFRAS